MDADRGFSVALACDRGAALIPLFKTETPAGALNGLNAVFVTALPYVPGTVQVWVNGQLKEPGLEDGWLELGGSSIQLNEAPRTTDVVRVMYCPQ